MYWELINALIRQEMSHRQLAVKQQFQKTCYVLKHNHKGSLTLAPAHFFEQATVSQQRYC